MLKYIFGPFWKKFEWVIWWQWCWWLAVLSWFWDVDDISWMLMPKLSSKMMLLIKVAPTHFVSTIPKKHPQSESNTWLWTPSNAYLYQKLNHQRYYYQPNFILKTQSHVIKWCVILHSRYFNPDMIDSSILNNILRCLWYNTFKSQMSVLGYTNTTCSSIWKIWMDG